MKIFVVLSLFLFPAFTFAQSRSNQSIVDHIGRLGAGKHIAVEHEPASKVTTIRAVSENFLESEVKKADIKAMNFAIGMMYVGTDLRSAAEPFKMSLWVMAPKPVFAGTTVLQIDVGESLFNIEDVRHVRRDRDSMEYVNFQLTRDQLKTLALQTNARIFVGRYTFTFTKTQLRLLADLYAATEIETR